MSFFSVSVHHYITARRTNGISFEQASNYAYKLLGQNAEEVHAPSAHERADALLSLAEWLDGKVSEEEKR